MAAKKKIGLALSGGGSKGAFTVGALKVIEKKLKPHPYPVISGTSTGSLIGTMLTTNQFTRLVEIYSNVRTENIVNPNHALVASILGTEAVLFASAILGGRAIFDTTALRKTIDANVDFQRVKRAAAGTLLIYNTVDLQTGRFETFNNRDDSPSTMAKALLASANQPVLMDPVVIRRDGRRDQYVDGGVREFLPLRAAFEHGDGLDHIIAISTSPVDAKSRHQIMDRITDILARTIDLMNSEVARDDYRGALATNAIIRLFNLGKAAGVPVSVLRQAVPKPIRSRIKKRDVPVTFIGPKKHLDMDGLTFEPKEMRAAMRLGVETAKEVLKTSEEVFV
ncbi:MAG: patatin-like phospholipase family protein [Planctomycetota bacterium]|jgi:predicted acylesterase/phospholipase RssA